MSHDIARRVSFSSPTLPTIDEIPTSTLSKPSRLTKQPTYIGPDLSALRPPAPVQHSKRSVTFLPSQVGTPNLINIAYTTTPLRLLIYDLLLCVGKLPSTSSIMLPWRRGKAADPYDEMYPNGRNLVAIVLHGILVVAQGIFILSLPWFAFAPLIVLVAYVVGFLFVNTLICMALNGTELKLLPSVQVDLEGKYDDEYWLFMNGVSVGKTWLQSNIDRLSLTFGRPVIGVHNPTSGIIFDLLQCLIQRNFTYSTQDVREAYACIKQALLDTSVRKVVFILHSQGGIEGGLILDWLFAEVSRDALKRLEVYTFGNAANHFNDPDLFDPGTVFGQAQKAQAQKEGSEHLDTRQRTKVIGHIEHYANAGDFVSQFGVLNYTRMPNRFMGRLFLAPDSGHLLNQHYLFKMFALNKERSGCADTNAFMDMVVRLNKHDVSPAAGREHLSRCLETRELLSEGQRKEIAFVGDVNAPLEPAVRVVVHSQAVPQTEDDSLTVLKVKDFSRLWLYRNGGSPDDDVVDDDGI